MLVFYVFQQSQIQGAFLGEIELETAKRESWESKGRRDINKAMILSVIFEFSEKRENKKWP